MDNKEWLENILKKYHQESKLKIKNSETLSELRKIYDNYSKRKKL